MAEHAPAAASSLVAAVDPLEALWGYTTYSTSSVHAADAYGVDDGTCRGGLVPLTSSLELLNGGGGGERWGMDATGDSSPTDLYSSPASSAYSGIETPECLSSPVVHHQEEEEEDVVPQSTASATTRGRKRKANAINKKKNAGAAADDDDMARVTFTQEELRAFESAEAYQAAVGVRKDQLSAAAQAVYKTQLRKVRNRIHSKRSRDNKGTEAKRQRALQQETLAELNRVKTSEAKLSAEVLQLRRELEQLRRQQAGETVQQQEQQQQQLPALDACLDAGKRASASDRRNFEEALQLGEEDEEEEEGRGAVEPPRKRSRATASGSAASTNASSKRRGGRKRTGLYLLMLGFFTLAGQQAMNYGMTGDQQLFAASDESVFGPMNAAWATADTWQGEFDLDDDLDDDDDEEARRKRARAVEAAAGAGLEDPFGAVAVPEKRTVPAAEAQQQHLQKQQLVGGVEATQHAALTFGTAASRCVGTSLDDQMARGNGKDAFPFGPPPSHMWDEAAPVSSDASDVSAGFENGLAMMFGDAPGGSDERFLDHLDMPSITPGMLSATDVSFEEFCGGDGGGSCP